MKSSVHSFIKSQIAKILSEDDALSNDKETIDTFDKMDKFVKDEETANDLASMNSKRMISAVKDPNKKNIENLNLKSQAEKKKKLDLMKKNVEDQKKNYEDNLKQKQLQDKTNKLLNLNAQTTPVQTNSQTMPQIMSVTETFDRNFAAPVIKRGFAEQNIPAQTNNALPPLKKAYIVKFDKNTEYPFDVKFTERGFAIEGTRLSFEAVENALSKNYIITLNNGQGFVLTSIRMQQILKYKSKWF